MKIDKQHRIHVYIHSIPDQNNYLYISLKAFNIKRFIGIKKLCKKEDTYMPSTSAS